MIKPRTERFIGLEWLRFLLGCYVMIYHTAHVYPQIKRVPFLSELTSMGFFATSTFFVLSGFLLAHVYIRGGQLREPASHFWAKRLFTLYPIHIMALLASIAVVTLMQWLAVPPEGQNEPNVDPESLRHYMTNAQLLFNGLLQVFMLQEWNPYFLTLNAPLWSLSTLFFFYLLFPALGPRLLNSRHPWLWLGIVCLLYLIPPVWIIWEQQFGMPYTGLLQRGPIFRLPEFLAGILGYALFRHYRDRARMPLTSGQRSGVAAFILLNFIAGAWLFTNGEAYWYFLLHNGLLLPAQVGLVCLSALARDSDSHWRAIGHRDLVQHHSLFLRCMFRCLICSERWSNCYAAILRSALAIGSSAPWPPGTCSFHFPAKIYFCWQPWLSAYCSRSKLWRGCANFSQRVFCHVRRVLRETCASHNKRHDVPSLSSHHRTAQRG